MTVMESVFEALADALPNELSLLFHHVSTPPVLSSALFSAIPGRAEATTFCESHFLAASLPAEASPTTGELLVFAIEVLVFTSQSLNTIFISKADSTGYLGLLKIQPGTPSIVKTICTTFLSFLVNSRLQGPRVILSLFARSQNQYLFPGSIENSGKHVLDDRKLIKWWCRVLDPLLQDCGPSSGHDSSVSSDAYLIVPGCDRFETKAFFPPINPSHPKVRWSNVYPQDMIAPEASAPPRCLIPRFPDDPKARFLDELDSEICGADRLKTGKWRSVQSIDQFWEMMSYRQECSAGRLVGFIWVVFTPSSCKESTHVRSRIRASDDEEHLNQAIEPPPPPDSAESSSNHQKTAETYIRRESAKETTSDSNNINNSHRPDGIHNANTFFYSSSPSDQKYPVRWTISSRGELILPVLEYQFLMTHLLASDFSTQDLATESTSSWITKAAELAASSSTTTSDTTTTTTTATTTTKNGWGKPVTGRNPVIRGPTINPAQPNGTPESGPEPSNSKPDPESEPVPTPEQYQIPKRQPINILTGIRKKQKRSD